MDIVHLDATDLRTILDIAQVNHLLLDEITRSHFLHGDLWMVNILIKRDAGEPKIVAILDSDGASCICVGKGLFMALR